MPIVNHTGDVSGDETWAVTDEHHITGAVSFDGGSTGNPRVVTIEAGVIIYFDGNFILLYSPAVTDYGMVNFLGTEADKITLQADPTVFPYAGTDQYYGLFMGYHVKFDMDWVLVKHSNAFLTMWCCTNDTTDGGAAINNCSAQYCQYIFQDWPGVTPSDKDVNNLIVVDGLFCKSIKEGIYKGDVYDLSGSNPLQNVAIYVLHCTRDTMVYNMLKVDVASKTKFEFTNLMISGVRGKFLPTISLNAGEWLDITVTGLFADANLFMDNLAWGANDDGHCGVIVRQSMLYRALTTIQDSVIAGVGGAAVDVGLLDSVTESFTIQRCDLINNGRDGINYKSANTTLIMDNLYLAYNWGFECIGSGANPQPGNPVPPYGGGHYQWWDVSDAQAPTNVQATPVFPLDVENVVEGAPGVNAITITFDSKEGSVAGKRLVGIPFIRYGTASGGPYGSIAGIVPWDKEERYKVFSKWTSAYGTFETLNHSVTLDNLKAGTTYYYVPCFIDPLGRVAEGAEGTFDTTGSAVVRRDVSPSFSIRRM